MAVNNVRTDRQQRARGEKEIFNHKHQKHTVRTPPTPKKKKERIREKCDTIRSTTEQRIKTFLKG